MANRIMTVTAKCSDMCNIKVPHADIERLDYPPHINGLGGGDYIELSIDLDTGQLIGFKPLTDRDLEEIFSK